MSIDPSRKKAFAHRLAGAARRALAVGAVLALFGAPPIAADVTIVQETSATGMAAKGMGDRSRVRLDGMQMRSDVLEGDRQISSTILDLDARTMTVLDHKKERATVHDLSELAQTQQQIGETDVKVSVDATGETREILGETCAVHHMEISVSGGSSMPMPVTVVVGGPVCLVPDAPGLEDYRAFYTTMAERGLFFGAPEQAEAQPGQVRGMALLYEEMAEKGVAYRSDLSVAFEGEGFMANMLNKLSFTTTSEIVEISTDEIPGDVFQAPAGWKVKER